ncbi:hypothetical protein [Megalodesulfovibrio gigas]|uniref:Uncharacterized protein n=1 Tax=Megalodesulfovibrio gigas (strain ATCC 19364 / DSM 1382 / NCIMB 9332 / VKM B-1759) TaxID=1121448 RepID=T2GCR3_MEGG1|nr:hypothetical protein [Megalodesulfovibrio gigas]AGW14068.1 hypothetical protein DGI_2314 [Megalodesulfovibrio gigas DSM 1382 = ATCC 19364]
MTRADALALLKDYLDSGDARMDFDYGSEDTRYKVLDLLEQLIELGEAADALATSLIFKGGLLEMLAGGAGAQSAEAATIQSQREDDSEEDDSDKPTNPLQ